MSRRRDNAHIAWLATVCTLLAIPACSLGFDAHSSPTGARAATGATPQLGRASTPVQIGFGRVRPKTISLGGDPTGLVQHIHWTSWGGARAIGYGDAEYEWPGTAVANNGFTSGARVVAFHLGSCRGHRSYNALEWYFPKYEQAFNPHEYTNACTGAPAGVPKVVSCPNARLAAGAGTATFINVAGMSCETASQLIAEAPVAQYLTTGGRFVQSGFRCGTEGAGELGSAIFSCQKGTFEFSYDVAP
ncbi:MAG: hypothetical protein WBQ21_02180 [Solirubrobacteraceae bacterium]